MDPDQDVTAGSQATPNFTTSTPATPPGLPPGVSAESLWEIARHQGVIRMRLVGAWARGGADPTAPVDLIIGFQRRATQMDIVRLRLAFEGVSGRRFMLREESSVSLADREALRREARLL